MKLTAMAVRKEEWLDGTCEPGYIPMGTYVLRHGMPVSWFSADDEEDEEEDNNSTSLVIFERHHLYVNPRYYVSRNLANEIMKFSQQRFLFEADLLEIPIDQNIIKSAQSFRNLVDLVNPYRDMIIKTASALVWTPPLFRSLCELDEDFPDLYAGKNYNSSFSERARLLEQYLRKEPEYVSYLVEAGASRGNYLLVTDDFMKAIEKYEPFDEHYWMRHELCI